MEKSMIKELKSIGKMRKSGPEWEKIEVTLKDDKGYIFFEIRVFKLTTKGKWEETQENLTIPIDNLREFKELIEEAEKTISEITDANSKKEFS